MPDTHATREPTLEYEKKGDELEKGGDGKQAGEAYYLAQRKDVDGRTASSMTRRRSTMSIS